MKQFGDAPQLRLLDFFIDNRFFDFPLTKIARESNIGYNSFKVFLPYFVKNGIIFKTRRIGRSDYNKLNLDNPFLNNLMKLDWMVEKNMDNIEKPNLQKVALSLNNS